MTAQPAHRFWLIALLIHVLAGSAVAAETLVFVEEGTPARIDTAATLGEVKAGEGYLGVRSAKPGSTAEYAAHHSSIVLPTDTILAAGDVDVRMKIGVVRLDQLPAPLTLGVKVGAHYYDLLLADGAVTVQGIRYDAVRYEPIELRHAVPMKLDGTPFTLALVRKDGLLRITLDDRLLQELWVEPSSGDVALLVDRESLLRVTDHEDVEAELRVYDWRASGTFVPMTDERRAWNALAPRPRQLMKRVGNAYGYVVDDPKLPNVLLIGDSISIYYTDPVRRLLAGQANVFRTPMGPGKAETLFTSLDEFLKTRKWDVIHFNTGLHDFGHKQGTDEELAAFSKNLETIIGKLEKTGANLVWASTTPVPPNSPATSDELAVKYNAVAKSLMDQRNITTNDLHSLIKPNHRQYWLAPKNVHFNDLGSAVMGRRVAQVVLSTLEAAGGKQP